MKSDEIRSFLKFTFSRERKEKRINHDKKIPRIIKTSKTSFWTHLKTFSNLHCAAVFQHSARFALKKSFSTNENSWVRHKLFHWRVQLFQFQARILKAWDFFMSDLSESVNSSVDVTNSRFRVSEIGHYPSKMLEKRFFKQCVGSNLIMRSVSVTKWWEKTHEKVSLTSSVFDHRKFIFVLLHSFISLLRSSPQCSDSDATKKPTYSA